jgi:hypothetical protein
VARHVGIKSANNRKIRKKKILKKKTQKKIHEKIKFSRYYSYISAAGGAKAAGAGAAPAADTGPARRRGPGGLRQKPANRAYSVMGGAGGLPQSPRTSMSPRGGLLR